MAAVLQLSAKYEAHSLRKKVIGLLSDIFPTSFEAYSATQERCTLQISYLSIPILCALVIAFEVAAPSLLPYSLLRLQRVASDHLMYILDGVEGRGRRLYLTPTLQRAVLQGRPGCSRVSRTIVFPSLFRTSQCVKAFCDSERLAYLGKICKPDGYLDPLQRRELGHVYLCNKCREVLETDYQAGRPKVWEQLPGIFGLPGGYYRSEPSPNTSTSSKGRRYLSRVLLMHCTGILATICIAVKKR